MMTKTLKIGVQGAAGRMGQAVIAAVRAAPDLDLVALADAPDRTGQVIDGLTLGATGGMLDAAEVVIDFSTPAASLALARAAAERGGAALVIGTTGLAADDEETIAAAARRIPIVKSGNYSIGVNVLAGLVRQAAERLGPEDWDVEILESHHRRKVDAPSGTALLLGAAAAAGRNRRLEDVRTPAREGITGARPSGTIGFAALRGGGIVGEHSVTFAADEEIITLSHSARDRGLFARGAVAAARWVAGRQPGLYDMMDVLGF
jgi:4-hydroxy-tetrahydrodipicolinate reductase